ncbi:tRNA guanosine(15) transglycosylase TgtA [Candidatus Bathyarchaeota archaeon A05DMB-2]|jgi:7-cyano-7-deazaguanine tRNA-ribosyltransferase|nr:tRNA guanosine(15) transglycosylase TgtA [Candidatus Bathyarchaeota archaeon A05DMB-2]
MSFEVKEKDLLARIGKLKTKSGTVETPLLFPVVNPSIQLIPSKQLKDEFGFEAVITNAYILKKRYQNKPVEQGVHHFLGFDGAVMTDSGAYQILVYGNVGVTQAEIVEYQEQIGSDIATILDIPTGWKVTREHAEATVMETLERAKIFLKTKTRDDILWVGPVQGGRHLDLVAKSAVAMGKMPFQIHALGSPTEVMENYRYDVLVDMILAAKRNLPAERPLHLFGAGHPAMFALAVALGCDSFDSAAYALYAREGRYMTENGTWSLSELDYFPCQCPKCAGTTPKTVAALPKNDKEAFLAEHNLYVCIAELRRIKQSVRDGRLWEHLEMRAHGHPALFTALKKLKNHVDFIEKYAPAAKKSGLFFFNSAGLARPEVVRYRNRLRERYTPPQDARVLLLVPQSRKKPFHKAQEFNKVRQAIQRLSETQSSLIHICFYAAPFGVVPLELDEVYPLSQHETALPLDRETIDYVANQLSEYVEQTHYGVVVLVHDPQNWRDIVKLCGATCRRKGVSFDFVDVEAEGGKNILTRLELILRKHLSE